MISSKGRFPAAEPLDAHMKSLMYSHHHVRLEVKALEKMKIGASGGCQEEHLYKSSTPRAKSASFRAETTG